MSKDKKIKSYWNEEIWPKFNAVFNDEKLKWYGEDTPEEYFEIEKQYYDSVKKYNTNHSEKKYLQYKYGLLPLSFITIVPFYWTYKKYKSLKRNKDILLNECIKLQKEKFKYHPILAKNLYKIIDNFNNIFPYKNMGPVIPKLVQELDSASLLKSHEENDSVNPYNTSWGILDNKIIIHVAKQEHKKTMQEYTGSVSVPYQVITTDSDGNRRSTTHYETVYASYSHPAHVIETKNSTFVFMESCSELEFYYEGPKTSSEIKEYNQKYNYSALENEEFESRYKWRRTNDVQFRMVFTPWTQESFLKEAHHSDDLPPELLWQKHGSFLFNRYTIKNKSLILEKYFKAIVDQFLKEPTLSYEDFKKNVGKRILEFYNRIYKATNYMYNTTIMASEDHTEIIKHVVEKPEFSVESAKFFAFYVINEYFNCEICKYDTDCFYVLGKDETDIEIDSNKVVNCRMIGISFEKIEKVKNISRYAANAGVTVQVPITYYNYVAHQDDVYIGYIKVNTDKYYMEFDNYVGAHTNIVEDEINSLINLLKEQNISIAIRHNILSILSYDDNIRDNIDIIKLIKLVNNK